jgi:phosphatidylinositol alpha-1,6-mannosyltransferase
MWELYSRLPRGHFFIAAGENQGQAAFDATHDLPIRRLPLALENWGLRSWRGLTGYARAVRRLSTLISEFRIQQIHCACVLPEGLMALALKKWFAVPYICYAHGEELTCAGSSRELRWLMNRVLTNSELIICNSRNTLNILASQWGLTHDKLAILHPGCDTDYFRPAPRNESVRARLGWGRRPVILTVGRLQKRKGHDIMLRALATIRSQFPQVLYAIVGSGEEEPFLRQLVDAEGLHDHVCFHGELNDDALLYCYQQCDVFVLPNRQVGKDIEGFGMVLVEAQACGKPVIAGASGGTAETMIENQTGWIADCTHPGPLIELISTILNDSRRAQTMGRDARLWSEKWFNWSSCCQRAAELFDKATKRQMPAQRARTQKLRTAPSRTII